MVVPGPRGRRRRGACAAGSPARGRRPRCRCPVRLLVAQPTMRRENRPRDEGGAAEPRPGRHAGEVDHPAPVWAGGGGSRGAAGRAGTGFPLAGPVVRTVLPGPAPAGLRRPHAPHPRRVRATPGPSCREPGSRQVFPEVPGARVEAARPPGARIPSRPRGDVRDRPLGGRAGPGGVIGGRGRSCTPTRSGRCRSGTGPATPPLRWSMQSADQRDGRSHSAAMDKPTRPARSRPPPPARGPPTPAPRCAGPPRWWCRAGRRRPTRTPPAGSRPRRVSGPAPSPFAHAPQTPPRPVRDGPGRPGVNPIARPPGSSGRFPGAGMILILPWIQTLHHTQDDPGGAGRRVIGGVVRRTSATSSLCVGLTGSARGSGCSRAGRGRGGRPGRGWAGRCRPRGSWTPPD